MMPRSGAVGSAEDRTRDRIRARTIYAYAAAASAVVTAVLYLLG